MDLFPGGQAAISASDDQTIAVWNLDDGSERLRLSAHWWPANAVVVTPDGRYTVSGASCSYQVREATPW